LKKIAAFLFSLAVLFMGPAAHAAQSEMPDLSKAGGAVLIERDTLRILEEKDKDKKLPMASTTKIMTAILAIENGNLNDGITVSKNASGVEGSSIWLGVGEHVTLEDLLYGLMLSSGNDAAVAVAEHISGSVDNFVALMNAKAIKIGAKGTNFANPNGLYDKNHYTTAYDLSLIAAYAMKNETFRKIVSTVYWEMPWEGHAYKRVLKNKNRNLWEYEGATGIKTGYTRDAGRCYVGSATKDGMELITVLLDDYDMFDDSRKVFDYGFTNYQKVNIVNKGDPLGDAAVQNGLEESVGAIAGASYAYPCSGEELDSVRKTVLLDDSISAPVSRGDVIGKIEVYIGGGKMAEIPVMADSDVFENTYEFNLLKVIRNYLFG
jgi:D-alanyl-D-alanine carboxypeptidase (penicillin-binding protein 5/6)